MSETDLERRRLDRRREADRRSSDERRAAPTDERQLPTEGERRLAPQRRKRRRRSGLERRLALQSAEDQIRHALALLDRVAESTQLDDPELRSLDAAMFRLRFALDRLERED